MGDVWSPLTTKWAVNAVDSGPRPAGALVDVIDSIGHHHAASTSYLGTLGLFAPGGRTVSPNYFITPTGIIGIVPENRRPWTSASARDDGRSITYEILNSTGDPNWAFDPRTIENVKRLDADIMRRYPKVKARYALPGFWQHKNLYQWFGRSYPTACAGPSFPMTDIISGAQYLYDQALSGADEGIEVKAYQSQDRWGIVLTPGSVEFLRQSVSPKVHKNVVGTIGQYSITPHVYANGLPGDQIDVTLMWQDTRKPATDPTRNSFHYVETLTLGADGQLKSSFEFKRFVAEGFAVYAQVKAHSDNKGAVNITVLDVDAFAFVS